MLRQGISTTWSKAAPVAARVALRSYAKSVQDVPSPADSLGLLFSLGGLAKMREFSKAVNKEHGDLVRVQFAQVPYVYLYDPEDFKLVQMAEPKTPIGSVSSLEPLRYYLETRKLASTSVLVAQGEDWKRLRSELQRKILPPSEAESRLPDTNPVVTEASKRLGELQGPDFDVTEFFAKFAFEYTAKILFDRRFGMLEPNPPALDLKYLQGVRRSFFLTTQLLIDPSWQQTGHKDYTEYEQILDFLIPHGIKLAEETVQRVTQSPVPSEAYIAHLAKSEKISRDEIAVNIAGLFMAGIDTTSAAAWWGAYHLARNPQAQENLHQELSSVLKGGNLQPGSLASLPYLKACIKEALRLDAPVDNIVKRLDVPIELKGYHFPAGTIFVYKAHDVATNPKYFPNPEKYDPSRWTTKSATPSAKDSIFTLVPFSIGARMCLGARIAQNELHSLFARLVQDYRWELEEDIEVERTSLPLTRPVQNPKFRFHKRN